MDDIVQIAQGGAVVLLTAAVVALWRRLNAITDQFNKYLIERADYHGDEAAQKIVGRG
jgi:hypothetical protein